MTAKQQDIDDLFSMFHDFDIFKLDLQKNVLTIVILIPWGEMWGNYDYRMTFKFTGCDTVLCIYDKWIPDYLVESNSFPHPTEEFHTSELDIIESLKLDVQRHKFEAPDNYRLYCNSMNDEIAGATLDLKVSDFQIFDIAGEEIDLDKMKGWATEWWDYIERMWEERKNK